MAITGGQPSCAQQRPGPRFGPSSGSVYVSTGTVLSRLLGLASSTACDVRQGQQTRLALVGIQGFVSKLMATLSRTRLAGFVSMLHTRWICMVPQGFSRVLGASAAQNKVGNQCSRYNVSRSFSPEPPPLPQHRTSPISSLWSHTRSFSMDQVSWSRTHLYEYTDVSLCDDDIIFDILNRSCFIAKTLHV
jgi:hypothetical protein